MPDNLTIPITADLTLLRSQLAVAQRELTEFNRQLKEAEKTAAKTGDTTAFLQAAKNAEVANARVRILGKSLGDARIAAYGAAAGMHAAAKAGEEMGASHNRAVREVITLSREIGHLDLNTTGLAKAFREMPGAAVGIAAAGAAVAVVGKVVDSAAQSVATIEDLHQATGIAAADIVAMQKAFRDVNVDAKNVEPFLRKMAEDFTKAHEGAAGIQEGISGVAVLRPGGPRAPGVLTGGGAVQPGGFEGGTMVLRGGQPVQLDVSKGLAGLVDPTRFAQTAAGQQQWQQEALKVLAQVAETNRALALEIARAQVPGMQPEQALRALLEVGRPGAMAAARAATGGEAVLVPGATDLATRFQTAQKGLTAAGEDVTTRAGLGMMTGATNVVEATTQGLDATSQHMETTGKNWQQITKEMDANWDTLKLDVQAGVPTDSAETFTAAWKGAFEAVGSAWSEMVASIKANPVPAARGEAAIPPAGGMAAGGTVPGSGMGDSVHAMLTPGEYVNRLSSVQYYGANLFHALNSRLIPRDVFRGWGYSLGGLVDSLHAPPRHYAEGGMVESAGGRLAVDINMGGHTFPMSSDREVASRLVRFARSESMRSAGIKPSWVS